MVINVREGVLAGLKENPLLQFPLSALQQEKLQRTLGEQTELMQEGVISPEVYGERKAIIEAAFTAQEILNLSHWDIIFEFSSEEKTDAIFHEIIQAEKRDGGVSV